MLKKIIKVGTFMGMALLLSACNQAGTTSDTTTGTTSVAPADTTVPNTTDTSTPSTTSGTMDTQSNQSQSSR